MEPPPPPLSSTAVASTTIPPESIDSSPRSRTTDVNWDDLPPPPPGTAAKLRLMCSYGGHILPRPHDKALCYMGGDTRIVVVDRNSSLSSLLARLSTILLNGRPFTLKYQLPSEDLDSLISVTTDEDLENMIEEYDRTTAKSSRLRLYLFTPRPESTQSMGQILENSSKSDQWFLDCLNNNPSLLLNRGYSDSDTNVNRLLGLDDCLAPTTQCTNGDDASSVKSAKQQQEQPPPLQQGGQDVPESPMLDTSSSFGSTTSSPSLANLPPIRVHVEDSARAQDQRLGIEEQFARINAANKEDGFAAMSSPPPLPVTIALPAAPVTAANEFQTRVFSDDERSDHGLPAGHRKPPTPRSQPQNNMQPQVQTHQLKSNNSGHDLPSPNSISSDSSLNNPMFQQRSVYQEPIAHMPSPSAVLTGLINPADPNTFLPKSQNQDQAYTLQPQFDQQSQPQQQPQPQFIHAAGPQYIHHHPSPGPTYIQVYPSQPLQHQQSFHRHPDQQTYPVYYVTSPVPPRPYVMPVPHSPSPSEAPVSTMMPPTPSNHMRSVQPEMGQTAVYTTANGAQMVHQIPTSQPQFMAYSHIHHPPQSGSAVNPNYAYEYADNAPKQMYYTQPMGYQTMTAPPPAMVMPDGSATPKLPADNMTQQIRSSQPL